MTPEEIKAQIESQREKIQSEMKKMRQEFQEKSKKFFSEATKLLFAGFPKLQSFAWQQGEYFNDETYNFRAHTYSDSLWVNVDQEVSETGRSTYEIKQDIKKFSDRPTIVTELNREYEEAEAREKEHMEMASACEKMLKIFNDDDFEVMFGDGYKVTVNRDGTVETEEHSYY